MYAEERDPDLSRYVYFTLYFSKVHLDSLRLKIDIDRVIYIFSALAVLGFFRPNR